ncbi:MAG: hypothetical protein KKI08_00115 [Armatimonadetes bacterium]|nr:hypothetical protein [Armatimonadota bacterium]
MADSADVFRSFVVETVELLLQHQSARVGGDPAGQLCLTVSRPIHRSYRSLGHRKPDGAHQTYYFPEQPLDREPFMLDFDLWPVLERLAILTGEARYTDLVEGMAAAFARHGFDEGCGLGYLGEEAGLDVVRRCGVSRKSGTPEPHFKPCNSGPFPGLPLEVLWRHAPEQMHRMFRAMYWGLVTDDESMDFNRFCGYDFDDRAGRHAMVRCAGHCAFETAAARMIHWWANCFIETGDAGCLEWAERMTDKWAAIQHPESGLVPNFFGAVAWAENVPMPPGEWAETRGTALMAAGLMDAARELRRGESGRALADRVQDMAVRLARGTARYGFDRNRMIFREHLHLDGQPYEHTARYCFHTAEEKAAAVARDPEMAQVPVYVGAGFFRPGTYWEYCAGVNTPADLARVLAETGDAELRGLLEPWAGPMVEAALAETGPLTDEGAWTFRGTAHAVRFLLALGRRQEAETIGLAEVTRLRQPTAGDWWRMPERTTWLEALLLLANG